MKTRTLLVDAPNLLKRSFHGAKDVYTPSFGHIGGLYQFLTTVRKLIKEYKINKVILVWDGENSGIHRHRIDIEYKANRKTKEWYKKIELSEAEIKREKDKEQSILKQKIRIQAYAEELFLRQMEVDTIEADDLIAEYCLRYNKEEEILLYSNDRDFAQLLDLNITILFPNINQPITKFNYIMHFNHYYANALTLKIICGDTADNIKGIEGVGEDTLLKYFPDLKFRYVSVREICIKANEINQERISNKKKPLKALENILNNVPRLKTNFQLVNLREPILNHEALDVLVKAISPLEPKDRGSKNLIKFMLEDQFLTIYNSTAVQYIEPFYTVVQCEKDLYNRIMKKK